MDNITIRPVHADEWREVRELRLRALQDDAAAMAFVDTFETASARPDEFWQLRTRGGSVEAGTDAPGRQFVAVTDEGAWVGSLTVLVEKVGEKDFEGADILRSAGAIVGVYLDPAHRGLGVIQSMFDTALDWVRERGLGYARLYVHTENLRAQKAYERAGFLPTGKSLVGAVGPEIEMARDV